MRPLDEARIGGIILGTKINPGRWDCYERAAPDEQTFTLVDRDPLAPFLVSIWSKLRIGDPIAARAVFDTMCAKVGWRYIAEPDADKASDALAIALAMFRAQEARRA
jgi:hypothetical protein